MYFNTSTIIAIAGVISSLGVILGATYKGFKWLYKQKQQDVDLLEVKKENEILTSSVLAVLDGLKQLGCNGKVTNAKDMLEQYLNEKAHK